MSRLDNRATIHRGMESRKPTLSMTVIMVPGRLNALCPLIPEDVVILDITPWHMDSTAMSSFHAVGNGGFRQRKADEHFHRHLRPLDLRKAAAGLDHAYNEEQNEQAVANGFQTAVDILYNAPYSATFEGFGACGEQRPYLGQFVVPCGQRILQYFNNPVITHTNHLQRTVGLCPPSAKQYWI